MDDDPNPSKSPSVPSLSAQLRPQREVVVNWPLIFGYYQFSPLIPKLPQFMIKFSLSVAGPSSHGAKEPYPRFSRFARIFQPSEINRPSKMDPLNHEPSSFPPLYILTFNFPDFQLEFFLHAEYKDITTSLPRPLIGGGGGNYVNCTNYPRELWFIFLGFFFFEIEPHESLRPKLYTP